MTGLRCVLHEDPGLSLQMFGSPFGQKWASSGLEVMLKFGHTDPREAGSSGQKFGHGCGLATISGHSSDMDSGWKGRWICCVGSAWGAKFLRMNWGMEAGFDPNWQVNEHLQADPAPITLQGDRCARIGMSTSSDTKRPQAELCTKIRTKSAQKRKFSVGHAGANFKNLEPDIYRDNPGSFFTSSLVSMR